MSKPIPRVILYALMAWVFVSAFYYAGNFITGDILASRASDPLHKAFKYLAAFSISLAFMIAFRLWSILLYYMCLSIFLIIFLAMHLSGLDVQYAIDVFVVLISFSGFVFFVSKLDDRSLKRIIDLIIASAVIVSAVSFFEYFFMESILGDYWRNTGGFRSISTLLNPNNLGLYLGAASLFLIFSDKSARKRKLIILPIFFTALFMSGSRTALFSLFFALFLGSIFASNWYIRVGSLLKWLVVFLMTGLVLNFIVPLFSFEAPERAVNMDTAVIRIEKYSEYVLNIDASYILPDFSQSRIEMVSESAYFHLINALGIAFFIPLVMLLAIFFRINLTPYRLGTPRRILGVVFVYYFIASLFENVLMSFPNNQLFFISAGSVLAIAGFSNLKAHSTHNMKLVDSP